VVSTPRAIAWTKDGERLIVGCSDGIVRIVHVENVNVTGEFDSKVGRIHDLGQVADGIVVVAGQRGHQELHLD
jgi:hypothetical protein